MTDAPLTLWIVEWDTPPIDAHHDPRSDYAEHFWLPAIGPTCLWLLRHLVREFERAPDGFMLDTHETALLLGVSPKGKAGGGVPRALHRLVRFHLAAQMFGGYAVRRRLPLLPGHQLRRLPAVLQERHAALGRGRMPT